MEKFASRLKIAIEKCDISAAELSRRTGIAKGTISNYLTGRYKAAQDNLYSLSKALNVSESWLAGYDEDRSISNQIIIKFNSLTEEHRKTIIDLINLYAGKDEECQEKED